VEPWQDSDIDVGGPATTIDLAGNSIEGVGAVKALAHAIADAIPQLDQ
jgi:hypothetical protein